MRILLLLACLIGAAQPALAASSESLTLSGQARTGADQRAVRFTFLCSSSQGPNVTGVLGVDLVVPAHDSLRPVFDFDPFEGPDARAGRLTQLDSAAEGHGGALRAMVSGSIGADGDSPFVFSFVAARRRDAARLAELVRLLAPLTQGAGQLTWTQGQVRPGSPPIIARLEVSAADAARLQTLLAPCLG